MKAKNKAKVYALILLAFPMLWAFLTLFFTLTVFAFSRSILISYTILTLSILFFIFGRIYLNQIIVRLTLAKGELGVLRNTLRYIGSNNPRNVMYLAGECDAGNYAYVISCCAKQLQQKRNNKMHRYHCLHLLAHCYYALGDDAKLDRVCRVFEDMLANQKNPEPIARTFEIMQYYRAFLDKDAKRCYALLEKEQKIKDLSFEYGKKFHAARIEQDILGNTERARDLYAQAAQGPADFAFVRNSAVGVDYRKEFGEVLPDFDVSLKPSKEYKTVYAIFLPLLLCISIVCAVLYVNNYDKILDRGNQAQIELELIRSGYREIEQVEIFHIKHGEKSLESVFICVADGKVVLGGSYVLEQNDSKVYHEVIAAIPAEQVQDADTKIEPLTVPGAADNLTITFGFYRAEQEIPLDAEYVTELQIDGEPFYVVVLDYVQSLE